MSEYIYSLSGKFYRYFNYQSFHTFEPSIDVLFDSAADGGGGKLAGVLVSGANSDGAAGMKPMKKKGGLTIVEDPVTAYWSIMQVAAIKTNKIDFVLSIDEIIKKYILLTNNVVITHDCKHFSFKAMT